MAATEDKHSLALQKYVLLQEQHEDLCSRLDQIRPPMLQAFGSSAHSSPSTSPTRLSRASSYSSATSSASGSYSPPSKRHCRAGGGRRHSRPHARCSGWEEAHRGIETLDPITDEDTIYEISAEERRLCDVNESIKRALMELLSCETVRCDSGFRTWVQSRLMETEQELRSGRKRRKSRDGM